MITRYVRRSLAGLAVLALLAIIFLLLILSNARVEMTEHNVHKRLLIPLLGESVVALPIYSGTGEKVDIPEFLEGPIITRLADGSWSAKWYCENKVWQSSGAGKILTVDCGGERNSFPTDAIAPSPAVANMPDNVAILSDIEGNDQFLDAALRKMTVTDGAGNWQFGKGNLVILGDSVDRGRDVYAVLWRLYRLSMQANSAGGAVRLVIGNHEQYILRSNFSRANPEHLYALNRLGGYEAAFAPDTLIGQWLRQQPVMLKLGRTLFAHGGVSAGVTKSTLDIAQLNKAMRNYWNAGGYSRKSKELDAVFGQTGITQYRGYFQAVDGLYLKATQAEIDHMLRQFDAERIVVAHTIVDKVTSLYNGSVYAVDVNSADAKPDVLMFRNGKPEILNIGISRNLLGPEQSRFRSFSLFAAEDRRLLADMIQEMRRLSSLPHPY